MGRFRNTTTGVVISVADSKDSRYGLGWEPAADPGRPAGTAEPEESAGYEGMKVPALKAEIEKRNQDRDEAEKLSTEGLKADLVAVLTADDAKADAS